jgi:hypothetical protein
VGFIALYFGLYGGSDSGATPARKVPIYLFFAKTV